MDLQFTEGTGRLNTPGSEPAESVEVRLRSCRGEICRKELTPFRFDRRTRVRWEKLQDMRSLMQRRKIVGRRRRSPRRDERGCALQHKRQWRKVP